MYSFFETYLVCDIIKIYFKAAQDALAAKANQINEWKATDLK